MERKSSIHIEQGNLGFLFHNDRTKPTANSIFSQEKNEYFNDAKTALEIYRQELQKRSEAYTKRTGKKPHKNAITHLSAIVNLDKQHTLQDVKKIAEYLEQKLGTKVFQISIHKDEGYIDEETGEPHINYHAHLEFMGLDEQGNSIRRKLDRKFLINLQDKVAEILQMERGVNYTAERRKRPKRLDTYEYKEHARRQAKYRRGIKMVQNFAKQFDFTIKNETDLKEFIGNLNEALEEISEFAEVLQKYNIESIEELKDALEQPKEGIIERIAKVKDLKELNKQLREQLKQAHAGREQYAQLEAFVKQLKEQVKSKDLTITQLKEQMQHKEQELLEQIQQLQDKNNTLLQGNTNLNKELEQVKQENARLKEQVLQLQLQPKPEPEPKVVVKEKIVYREDTQKIEQLKKELQEQKAKNEELLQLLKQKDEEIAQLKQQLQELKQLRYRERKEREEEIKELRDDIKEHTKEQERLQELLAKKEAILQEIERKKEDEEDEFWLLPEDERFSEEYEQLEQIDKQIEELQEKTAPATKEPAKTAKKSKRKKYRGLKL